MHSSSTWQQQIDQMISACDAPRGLVALMPEYRPDIARAIAHHIGCQFKDFRQEVMREKQRLAHTTSLEELSDFIVAHADQQPLLVFNAEALLATKAVGERRAWLREFLQTPRNHWVVLPIAIFIQDVPIQPRGVVDLQACEFHDQSLINRLAF